MGRTILCEFKYPSNCKFQWKSSDPKIASVDMQGKIIVKFMFSFIIHLKRM